MSEHLLPSAFASVAADSPTPLSAAWVKFAAKAAAANRVGERTIRSRFAAPDWEWPELRWPTFVPLARPYDHERDGA
jgi:hypothetical protein